MVKPHGQLGWIACALALSVACARTHSRGHSGDPDEVESDPSPVESEPMFRASDGSGSSAASAHDAIVSAAADDPRDGAVASELDAGAPEAAAPAPDLTLQVFDPQQVYLLGAGNGDLCETAVAPAEDPGRISVGFACTSYGTVQIRPSDGRLLYSAYPGGLRVFSCEGCVPHVSGAPSPHEPESNHDSIPSPCAGNAAEFPEFRLLPDGSVLHKCGEEWRDQAAKTVATSEPFVSGFGHQNTALRADGVFDLSTAQLHPFVGLPEGSRGTSRVRADGYWIVCGERGAEELWQVAFDGTARRLGAYAAVPETQLLLSAPKLDGQGRLYYIAREAVSARSTLVRRGVDGTSEIIYVDPVGSHQWGHLFFLFTGP